MKNITDLKQLSTLLKLSQTTVSRALNGFPEVNEKTRLRVELAAKKYNYLPNTRAKRLASGRSMTIGHIVTFSKEYELVNPIFSDFIAGASERYNKSNYDLMLTLAKEDDEERIYKDLAARSAVDGVILHGPKINDNRINMLNELRIPFVVHGRSSGSKENYNWVDVNNESAFFRATEFLIDLGHKSIALINGDPNMDFAMRRNTGYGRALEAAKISIDDTKKFNGEMTEPFGYKCTIDMLESNEPPSAIIASSIIVAIGIRRALDDKGLKIGSDISVLTFDDDLSYFRDEGTVPLFTSTKSSVREAGYKSANLLLEAIMNPTDEKKGILLEAELTIGRSTKSFKPIF